MSKLNAADKEFLRILGEINRTKRIKDTDRSEQKNDIKKMTKLEMDFYKLLVNFR